MNLKRKGFTLIELLIAIAVVTFMAIISAAVIIGLVFLAS